MTREEKDLAIQELTDRLTNSNIVYLADTSNLTVEVDNKLRRTCFSKQVSLNVVKNTLLKKAMERVEGKDYSELYDLLIGSTSIMISETGSAPAKVIKEFRKANDKPVLKGAYIEEAIYVGDDKLEMLASLKSKDELLGEIITLLQSPPKNVISALQSGKNKLGGLMKALEDRAEN